MKSDWSGCPGTARHFGADAEAEFSAILRLAAGEGHPPGFERRFDVERTERWFRHNPAAYTFYEVDGRLLGYRCLLPISPQVYWQLRRTDLAARDLHRDDILAAEEAERCQRTGVAYLLSAWSEADPEIYKRMLADTFEILGSGNLQGLYVETSGPHEEFCQAMGLHRLPDKGICPHTQVAIHAWCADREFSSSTRTPLTAFFQQVDANFGAPAAGAPPIHLSEREKAVAHLYFVRRRTREETAARLHISPNTVQDHVNAVLRACELYLEPPYLPDGTDRALPGSSPRTRVGDLLERFPQVLAPGERAPRAPGR